ncbi:deaminase domain-containing protein [Peribacillus frigoritolerans]|uniref:deaminase domain-containing protein n=1 Tax=Peribacillus frigoritolerans TaxID=450367 RepID=UPI0024C20170|nr:deaminase domain-containing protein [Peribacillus frigoritolerans]WHX62354.1 deaminase domain-containing protein [Peribacillus frigoritolerans]
MRTIETLKVVKYSKDNVWGPTLHYMAEDVKKDIQMAIDNAASQEEEELLEDNFGGNIGCATLILDENGNEKTYFAYSGINKPSDRVTVNIEFVYLKPEPQRIFTTETVNNENIVISPPAGFPRYFDTEAKILEQIAEELGKNFSVSGTLNIYTEFASLLFRLYSALYLVNNLFVLLCIFEMSLSYATELHLPWAILYIKNFYLYSFIFCHELIYYSYAADTWVQQVRLFMKWRIPSSIHL